MDSDDYSCTMINLRLLTFKFPAPPLLKVTYLLRYTVNIKQHPKIFPEKWISYEVGMLIFGMYHYHKIAESRTKADEFLRTCHSSFALDFRSFRYNSELTI